jgi:integrase
MTKRRRKNGEGNIRRDERNDRWMASFKPQSGRRVYVTGRKGETWKNFKVRLDAAKRGADENRPVGRGTLASYLTDVWLPKVEREVEPRTHESYAATVNTHIIPAIGQLPLAEVQPDDIQRVMLAEAKAGRSVRTVNYIRAVARIALNSAIKARLIDRNAAALAEPLSGQQSSRFVVDPYSDIELAALVSVADTVTNGLMVAIAAFLGLRRGELLGLLWKDFDAEKGTILVERQVVREKKQLRVKHLKTMQSRRVLRLPRFLMDRIADHRRTQLERRMKVGERWQNDGFIFASKWGGPLDPRNAQRLYDVIVAKAGVRRRRFHDLRHTAASLQFERGTLDITVSRMLGHSSPRITKEVYAHVTPPMMDAATATMEEIYVHGEKKLTASKATS